MKIFLISNLPSRWRILLGTGSSQEKSRSLINPNRLPGNLATRNHLLSFKLLYPFRERSLIKYLKTIFESILVTTDTYLKCKIFYQIKLI